MTVAAVVFSAAVLAGAAPASASSGYGHLYNWSNTPQPECLALPGADQFYGDMIMWTCGASGQEFLTEHDDPYDSSVFQLYNNGACLGVDDSQSEGARVVLQSCNEQDAGQVWYTNGSNGQGYYELKNLDSGQCLSVSGGSTGNGADVIQWKCQGTADQYWQSAVSFN